MSWLFIRDLRQRRAAAGAVASKYVHTKRGVRRGTYGKGERLRSGREQICSYEKGGEALASPPFESQLRNSCERSASYQVPLGEAEQPPLSAVPLIAQVRAVVPPAARESVNVAALESRFEVTTIS